MINYEERFYWGDKMNVEMKELFNAFREHSENLTQRLEKKVDEVTNDLTHRIEKRVNEITDNFTQRLERKFDEVKVLVEDIKKDVKIIAEGHSILDKNLDGIRKDIASIKEKIEEHDIILLAQRRAK